MKKSTALDLVVTVTTVTVVYVLLRLVREHLAGTERALAYFGIVVSVIAILRLLNRWIHPEKYKPRDLGSNPD